MSAPPNVASFAKNTRQLFVDAIIRQEEKIILKLINALYTKVDPVIDGIFKDLSTHFMGTDEDIYQLLDGMGASVAGSYKALDAKYAYAKNSTVFWAYSSLDIPISIRKFQQIKNNQFSKKDTGPSLIDTLSKMSGLQKFGGIEIGTSEQGYDVSYGYRKFAKDERGRAMEKSQIFYNRQLQPGKKIQGLKMKLLLSFWGNLGGKLDNLEERLFSVDNNRLYHKLTGKLAYNRPLLLPFLQFYMEVVIPSVVQEIIQPLLRANSKGNTTLKIASSRNVLY